MNYASVEICVQLDKKKKKNDFPPVHQKHIYLSD